MQRRAKTWLISSAAVMAVICVATALFFRWDNRRLVASILKIPVIPASASWVNCRSLFTTDVLTTCVFSIDPSDFNFLLSGYRIQVKKSVVYKHAHDFPMSLNLGENFSVAFAANIALPTSDAPHGGSIDLLTNETRDHVLVHLYVE